MTQMTRKQNYIHLFGLPQSVAIQWFKQHKFIFSSSCLLFFLPSFLCIWETSSPESLLLPICCQSKEIKRNPQKKLEVEIMGALSKVVLVWVRDFGVLFFKSVQVTQSRLPTLHRSENKGNLPAVLGILYEEKGVMNRNRKANWTPKSVPCKAAEPNIQSPRNIRSIKLRPPCKNAVCKCKTE